ncbi:MAG: gephyrin-like molybdotransferase Glp [Solirubrobacteraceae bacterium]
MFLEVMTVAEALGALAPARRSRVVRVVPAPGVVPAADVRSGELLPARARATVDGYAVRASDTYAASETLPAFLELTGAVAMGAEPDGEVGPGAAMAIPTGGLLPHGADAVVMVEHTTEPMPGHVEITRRLAPGDGVLAAGEEAGPGDVLVPAGRPLRAADLGLLAAAGITEVEAHERPRVGIVSTGDEVVPASTAALGAGQVRDACAPALAGLVREAGGEPLMRGIVPDDAEALERVLGEAVAEDDLVVVSAGSSAGARDLTAAVVGRLGEIVCHGLALRPGKPTLLADCGGVPLVGLPGNPRSALVVFRLVGVPLVRTVAGVTAPPPAATAPAELARDVPSAAGRLDVVQVALRDGVATPRFGSSALLGPMAGADGYVVVPEPDTGLPAGAPVEVVLY